MTVNGAITTVAGTSSTLPNVNVIYTEPDSNTSKTVQVNNTSGANVVVPHRMTRRLLGSRSMNRSVRGPTAGRMFFFWVVGIADHISAVSLILPSEQTELLSLLTEKVAMPAQRKRSLLRCQPATVIR
jgi:hypothetical protein